MEGAKRRARLLAVGLVFGLPLLAPSAARAQTYTYSALLDTDSNPATGGTVTVVQLGEPPHGVTGIDAIVRVSLGGASRVLGPVTAELYSPASASFVTSYGGSESYPLGVAVGYHGFDAAEFSVDRLAVGNPNGPIGVTFTASGGANSDYTQTVTQNAGVAVGTIPTVSETGLLALILGLGGGAVWILGRRRHGVRVVAILLLLCGTASVAWAAVITLDGLMGDWAGVSPAVTDPGGDSSISAFGDIVAGFVSTSPTNLNLRIDVVGLSQTTVVGSSTVAVPRADSCGQSAGRTCESLVGNVVADSMRSSLGVDFALMNSGGLRDNLTCSGVAGGLCPAFVPPPFMITNGQIISVMPFRNRAVTLTISGAELKTILENGVGQMPSVQGRFPQVSGMCFTYDIAAVAGGRVLSAVRQANDGSCTGAPINLTAASAYTLAEPDFTATGGDGYPDFTGRFTTHDTLDQIVTEFVVVKSPISPAIQGRIACTTSGATACP